MMSKATAVRMLPLSSTQTSRSGFSFYQTIPFVDRWRSTQQAVSVVGHMSQGNAIVPFRDTGDAFHSMWTEVDAAKEQVLWQTYICKDDAVGKATMAKLEAAHARGVETELLYDCGGNITGRTRLTERLRSMGARVIRHRPFFGYVWTYVSSGLQWDLSPAIRNHRKILVVDRKTAFAGGLNIGDDYCATELGGNGRFRDTHCRVTGPAVVGLLQAYEDTKAPQRWKFSLKRWRSIVANALPVRRRQAQMQRAMKRGGNAMQRIRILSKRFVSSIQTATRGTTDLGPQPQMGAPISTNLPIAATKAKNPSYTQRATRQFGKRGTMGRVAMRRRLERVRERAQLFLDNQRERMDLRVLTKNHLKTTLADVDPVPESVSIHTYIPPFTQILSANPHTRDWSIQFALWHVTENVHRRLWITTPYYMPHRKLTRAILRAASRGVDVRIMAGSRTTTDPWFMWHASRHLSERFLRAGVRIYEFNGGQIMHAKTVVADSVWSCVGSYNWDIMSNKNMEVCVGHFEHSVAREMERQFLQDVSLSSELTLKAFQDTSYLHKVQACAAYYMLRVLEKITFFTYKDPDLMSQLD